MPDPDDPRYRDTVPAPRKPPPSTRRPPQNGSQVVAHDGEILTAVEVERRITKLSDDMEELTYGLVDKANAAGEAEADFKIKFHSARTTARAILDGNGPGGRVTNDEADDYAYEQSDESFRVYKVKEAEYQAARDALRSMQSRMDALRTIAANIRAQT